jgi:hypothetical protein
MVPYATTSWEIGQFGLGKDAVSWRQVRSWLDRAKVEAELQSEQDAVLHDFKAKNIIATATTEAGNDAVRVGLKTNHAYAVVGYDDARRAITLSDPYSNGDFIDATTNKPRDGVDDGVFTLTLPEFNKYFSHLYVARAAVN